MSGGSIGSLKSGSVARCALYAADSAGVAATKVKAALLDGYELMRQLVDNTDELAHCCVVVVGGPDLTADTTSSTVG